MTRDTKDDAMMICDSSPYARSQPPLKSGRLLNTSVMGDGSTRPIRPLSYPSCKDSKKGSKYGSDQGRDQKNPFTQVEDFKPKPEGYKLKLKCRDQNELRDRRTIQSHWNFKKSTMPVKRRELENPSPNTMILPGKRIKGDPAPKIRRAMTFNGVQNTGSIIDDFNTPLPLLPSFLEDGKDMIRRITPATLSNALSGVYNNDIGELHLIDCRYPFEFLGGHIQTAVNMTSISDLESKFFTQIKTKKTVLIFHCEYSVQRAPQMALYVRGLDRNLNRELYPYLSYPDIYILQGGYRNFFSCQKLYCQPVAYVEMTDPRYKTECNQGKIAQKKQFPQSSTGFLR